MHVRPLAATKPAIPGKCLFPFVFVNVCRKCLYSGERLWALTLASKRLLKVVMRRPGMWATGRPVVSYHIEPLLVVTRPLLTSVT